MVLRITNACIAGRSGMWNILVLVVTSSLLDVSSQEGLVEKTLPLMNNCTNSENLYTPYFVGQPYEGDISISATVGHHVLTVRAFDDDDPGTCNASVRYSLHPHGDTTALSHFAVDPYGGHVILVMQFDDTGPGSWNSLIYEFIVRATDDGCRRKHNETLVKVFLWGQPVCNASEQFYSMTTKPVEGEPAQSWCEGIPQAIYNGPDNGSVKYRIIRGDENDHFTINDTGVICNNVKLDREEIAEYHLLVNALFNHGASGTHMHDGTPMVTMTPDYRQDIRSRELCVFIQVEDINDNKPIFQKDTYAMGIYYDILLGTKIIKVMADDADIGNNSALLYEMEGSPSRLAIEKWSGSIYLAELLDNNKLSTFEFTVKATDDFANGLSSLRDTNVKIMTTSIQNVIVLTTLLPDAYMKAHSQELVRDLEEQLGLNVAIIDIGPSLSDERQIVVDETDIWYTCTYPQTHAVVAGEDILANPLDDKLKSKWAVLTTSQGDENRWKTTASSDQSIPIWTIVLLAVTLTLLLILVIAFVVVMLELKRSMKRSASLEALNREGSQVPNPYDNALISSDHGIDMETLSPPSPIIEGGNIPNSEIAMTKNLSRFLPARELQRDELENKEQLGGGHYGLVNRALLHRKIDGQRVAIKVAVKSLRNFYDVDNTESFRKELKVLTSLKQHQNVITLLGYCTTGDPKLLVFEFAPNGDLVKYLREHQKGLSSERLVKFALDVTKGMEYLSSKSIIHRDLAARNILVGEREICKIADFGLSRVGEIYSTTAQTEIPVFWTAPECINHPQPIYNQRTDVWSFGVVVWEIMSFGRRPFYEGTSSGVIEWLKAGNRLNQPDRCPDNVYEVMNRCWKWNQKERPKFKKLAKEIDSIHCDLANYLVTASMRTRPRYSRSKQYEIVNYGGQPGQLMESSIVEDPPGGSHG